MSAADILREALAVVRRLRGDSDNSDAVYVCDILHDTEEETFSETWEQAIKLWQKQAPAGPHGIGWWPQDEAGHDEREAALLRAIAEAEASGVC